MIQIHTFHSVLSNMYLNSYFCNSINGILSNILHQQQVFLDLPEIFWKLAVSFQQCPRVRND